MNVNVSIDLLKEMMVALEIANAFCGSCTSDDCTDAIAIPISDALHKAKCFFDDANDCYVFWSKLEKMTLVEIVERIG